MTRKNVRVRWNRGEGARSETTGTLDTSSCTNTELTETFTREDPVISKVAAEFAGAIRNVYAEERRGISEMEAHRRLIAFRDMHRYDPNLPDAAFDAINDATQRHDHKSEAVLIRELVEDSPYPEVRAVVRNDDIDVPVSTIRAWTIGLFMTTVVSIFNALFTLRYPNIWIPTNVVQLLAYPLGAGWAALMPCRDISLFGIKAHLNPGPFNVKEHVLIVVMANAAVGGGAGYFVDTVVSIQKFYKISGFGWGFNILFALSTQCAGFGLAGLVRRWVVEPAPMIWPSALASVAIINALHEHIGSEPEYKNDWSIARYKWLLYVIAAMFIWSWLPNFIFPALSYFAWVTWIKPNSVLVNQLFGQTTGISLGFPFTGFTLDWAQINSCYDSPLIAPWHASANILVGVIAITWVIVPAFHYTNTWYANYLPISQNGITDNTGSPYNISRILTPEHVVDPVEYEKYSPLFLSTQFAVTYGVSFAAVSALASHTILYHSKEIWERWRSSSSERDDIHMKIVRRYKIVPTWWYVVLLAITTAFAFAAACAFPTGMTASLVLLSLVIASALTIPAGVIQATTSTPLGLNVFTELIIGYIQPGHPIAMMLFKTFGYITMTQALSFCQDLKLGQYMHVPQRSLFTAQLIATAWSCFCQLGIVQWALGAISNICTAEAAAHFTCNNIMTFYNASVIWGAIGPKHLFSGTAIYKDLNWFWLLGFVLPIIIYGVGRAFPKVSMLRRVNIPLVFTAVKYIPPYNAMNVLAYCLVSFIFQKHIYTRARGWWMEYNYVTSAGMDIGLAICAIMMFFCVQLPGVSMAPWWGTKVIETGDYNGTARRDTLSRGETFGPAVWKW